MGQEQPSRIGRRLSAIVAADVTGYSRLMGLDEVGTARTLREHRAVTDVLVAKHGGRIVKTTGDGVLLEFLSVVDAVECAVAVQSVMAERNDGVPQDRRMLFRVGINLGDILIEGDDILGDGVNVAARLEGIAEPGGICISSSAYDQVRGKVTVEFADLGEQSLRNIDRPVRVYAAKSRDDLGTAAPVVLTSVPDAKKPVSLPDKPSMAVLPFANMSGDAQQEYFSDGIAEDIITILSHSPSLFVIARNSSFTYKGKAVDIKQVGRELGVRYVLEGSVRRGGNHVRITAQLIDAETGNHMWAERYDRDLVDIFAVQDEITEAVAIAIEPAVAQMEQGRALRKAPENLGAWEAYQRGQWHLSRIGVAENEVARRFFRRAIDLDPNFAATHAWLANAILMGGWLYQTTSLVKAANEALPLAQRAVFLDPLDAVAHTHLGHGMRMQGDHNGALAEARRALAISPNYSGGHHLLGMALLTSGQPREGIEYIRKAMRLDPHDPTRQIRLTQISIGHYYLREYEAAIDLAKEALRSYPDHPMAQRWLAAALGQAGRLEEARQAMRTAIALAPQYFNSYVHERVPWMRPEQHEHMHEGYRKAGWEG